MNKNKIGKQVSSQQNVPYFIAFLKLINKHFGTIKKFVKGFINKASFIHKFDLNNSFSHDMFLQTWSSGLGHSGNNNKALKYLSRQNNTFRIISVEMEQEVGCKADSKSDWIFVSKSVCYKQN